MKLASVRRREFLKTGALFVAAGAAMSAVSAAALVPSRDSGSTDWVGADLQRADGRTVTDAVLKPQFDRHVGERFEFVLDNGQRLSARLVSADEVASIPRRRPSCQPKQAFSLDFAFPAGVEPNAVACIEHPKLGRMLLRKGLHLVPKQGHGYTVYFN